MRSQIFKMITFFIRVVNRDGRETNGVRCDVMDIRTCG